MTLPVPPGALGLRFLLTRALPAAQPGALIPLCGGRVNFILLNPSTATQENDDPTTRRCAGFAADWGCAELRVTNLSPWRATSPELLRRWGAEPPALWRANLDLIVAEASSADLVVAGWGNHGAVEGRSRRALHALTRSRTTLHCLGRTKLGHPRHPLYVPKRAELVKYSAR